MFCKVSPEAKKLTVTGLKLKFMYLKLTYINYKIIS
jgi:hypothetical protein